LRLLLDTHAALWWLSADTRFGDEAAGHVSDDTNQVLLSAAVVWEVSVKRSLGKLTAPPDFVAAMSSAGVQPLAVTIEHAAAVEGLPWHHRDPFDRMLVAQAGVERTAIVSRDPAFRPYAVQIIW
jgi:PIN domain nuclease of toxin-antitoxin system